MRSDTEIRRLEDLRRAPKCVLFVEDNLEDFILASWALAKVHLRNKLLRVGSADEMLQYLRGMDQYLDRDRFPMPAVILMDMYLPGPSGLEAQAMLRTNLQFRHIPIIAISSSENISKLKAAVTCGAEGWMTKPFDAAEFIVLASELGLPLDFEHNTDPVEAAQWPSETLKSVLFVQDDENDYVQARQQLKKLQIENPIRCVVSGQNMVDYLEGSGEFTDRAKFPVPGVIILDMRLSSQSGLAVQNILRRKEQYRRIPLIVLGPVESLPVLRTAMAAGADGILTKPFDSAEFAGIAQNLNLPLQFAKQLTH